MNQPQEHTSDSKRTWSRLHLWEMQPVRDVLVVFGALLLIWLGQKVSVVTVPLILAIMLAYLFEPVIGWSMRRFHCSRRVSVIGIIAGVVLLVILPAIGAGVYGAAQLATFGAKTTANIESVQKAYNTYPDASMQDDAHTFLEKEGVGGSWIWIYDKYRAASMDEASTWSDAFAAATNWVAENRDQVAQTAAGVGVETVRVVLSFIGAAFGIGFMGFLTAFFFFFVSTEWVQFKAFSTGLLPTKNRDRIVDLLQKFDRVISGFVRGRITIAFIQAIVFSIGYFLIGVPGAFILGPLVAVLSIVPYLALVGLPISISLLALQGYDGFRGEWWWIVGAPTGLYFLGQALDDYIWTPLIQGKSTGMDTPTILFASIAGGALFGVFGLLIAIPLAACAKILIQEIFWPRFREWAEGRAADPLPIED